MTHKKRKKSYILRKFIGFCFILGFFGAGALLLWAASWDIPDFNSFTERKVAQSTKIYDRTGEVLLYDIHQDIKRTLVPYEDISRYIKNATVAIEDSEFYEHYGVKPIAFLRSVLVNLKSFSFSQGGSTITQQVIKNALLTKEKKISRKIKEWALAIKLEQVMSKEQILELYLNESPYGGSIYGIAEASQTFFNKDAKDVTLAEAAYLAALPQAPTTYSPYGNHRDKLEARKNLVLERMFELAFISEDEYREAQNEVVEFVPQKEQGIKAPHFVMYVREYLENTYGKDMVEQGGLTVVTTLDYELQEKGEKIVNKFALENKEKFNAENASLVATDPKTGQILVMVGSRNYFDDEIDGNFNVALAHRQPGSAFKPFVYASAFEKGYTPETVVFDLQTEFQTTCNPDGSPLASEIDPHSCYMPENYDGKYRGPVNLRDALAQSLNVPAVKVLYLTGLQDALKTAKDFGIKSLGDVNNYGLTLVLGGGEVSPLDITNAYGVFANDGIYNEHTPILKITNKDGVVLEEFSKHASRVLSETSAREISDILSDNTARTPLYGARSLLYFSDHVDVAAKTGTTNDYRDAWTVGYTPNIAVGAWAGNNDNSSMEKKISGLIITPLWRAFMDEALKKTDIEFFKEPVKTATTTKPILRGFWQGGESYFIDTISNKLATIYTPEETKEERFVLNVHSILYWLDKKNPLGEKPEHPEHDSQFLLWEYPVQKWVVENNIPIQDSSIIPTEFDDIHTEMNKPQIKVINPNNETIFDANKKIFITIQNKSTYPLKKLDFFINNVFIGSSEKDPFMFSFVPQQISNIKYENKLRVVATDILFNHTEASTSFFVRY